ncbi:MAG: SGNH/GDSL hydrolase family protein [Microbacteriaceae bacterium]
MPRRFVTGADSESSWPLTLEFRFPRLYSGLDFVPAFLIGMKKKITVSRLPDAPMPWEGTIAGADPVRVLIVGDSTAAGCGVTERDEMLAARIAHHIGKATARGATWRAIGQNGHRSDEFIRDYLEEALAHPADVIYISLGANDALGVRNRRVAARNLVAIARALRVANPDALIALSSLPAFFRFTRLPEPLRSTLYRIAQGIERTTRINLESEDRISMRKPPVAYPDDFFARDGFHPGPKGYDLWAQVIVDEFAERGELDALRR